MWHFFREKEAPYNLRKDAVLFFPPAKPTTHGTNSAHVRGTLIWNQLQSSIKYSKSTTEFQNNLKELGKTYFGCAICRKSFLFIYFFVIIILVAFFLDERFYIFLVGFD